MKPIYITTFFLLLLCFCRAQAPAPIARPTLVKQVSIPDSLLTETKLRKVSYRYGGDIRAGELNGDGIIDFVVFRSAENGMKPCFIGAFTVDGKVLWTQGGGGAQPRRPGAVTLYDLSGDGVSEVIALFADPTKPVAKGSMTNVSLQVRDGRTGEILRESAPEALQELQGRGTDWLHQRILVANLRGGSRPRDLVVKIGDHILAFDDQLKLLWIHTIPWNRYGKSSAYIPAVGDLDQDGRDEITGGLYLLDADGKVLWEKMVAPHMDSVTIAPWDHGQTRVIASGYGTVMDRAGNVIQSLGHDLVPHGQEIRTADFLASSPGPEMVLRYQGHKPDVLVADNSGKVLHTYRLNDSPNNTGLEAVYWHGPQEPALLYNGGVLWLADGKHSASLPALKPPAGPEKSGWYRCIPADIYGDHREDLIVFNPWDQSIYIYSQEQKEPVSFKKYTAGPRQYNARMMN